MGVSGRPVLVAPPHTRERSHEDPHTGRWGEQEEGASGHSPHLPPPATCPPRSPSVLSPWGELRTGCDPVCSLFQGVGVYPAGVCLRALGLGVCGVEGHRAGICRQESGDGAPGASGSAVRRGGRGPLAAALLPPPPGAAPAPAPRLRRHRHPASPPESLRAAGAGAELAPTRAHGGHRGARAGAGAGAGARAAHGERVGTDGWAGAARALGIGSGRTPVVGPAGQSRGLGVAVLTPVGHLSSQSLDAPFQLRRSTRSRAVGQAGVSVLPLPSPPWGRWLGCQALCPAAPVSCPLLDQHPP